MQPLPENIRAEFERLSAVGDTEADGRRFPEALARYRAAWDLLPEPKTEHDAATWLMGAIGDTNIWSGDFIAGRDNLTQALHCPEGIGNPLLHLRLGQCQFELGDFDRAADQLMRAYLGAGPEIFEAQDPKYIRFLQSTAENVAAPASYRPKPRRPTASARRPSMAWRGSA